MVSESLKKVIRVLMIFGGAICLIGGIVGIFMLVFGMLALSVSPPDSEFTSQLTNLVLYTAISIGAAITLFLGRELF